MTQLLEDLKKKAREETRKHCEEAYGQILDKEVIDATVEYWSKRTDTLIEQVWNARGEEVKEALKANIPDGEDVKVSGHRMNEPGVGGWNQLRYSILQNLDHFLTPKISRDDWNEDMEHNEALFEEDISNN